MYPFMLKPMYDQTIWAGDTLCRLRGKKPDSYGTCWEVSVHPYAQSVIENGIYQGKTLREVIDAFPRQVLGTALNQQNLIRLAFLDARDSLSVQVHPAEAYAQAHANDHGKTESWYIVAAKPGASLVAGTDCSTREELQKAVHDGTLLQHLRQVPVQPGDFICIDAGMLHALGAGILALEIGTNSNTTYRFYDYDRVDSDGRKRPLHLKESMDVVDVNLRSDASHHPLDGRPRQETLLARPEFHVDLIDVVTPQTIEMTGERYRIISNLGRDTRLQYGSQIMNLPYTRSVFLPADLGRAVILDPTRVLVSTVQPNG